MHSLDSILSACLDMISMVQRSTIFLNLHASSSTHDTCTADIQPTSSDGLSSHHLPCAPAHVAAVRSLISLMSRQTQADVSLYIARASHVGKKR